MATTLKNLGAKWLSEKKINFTPWCWSLQYAGCSSHRNLVYGLSHHGVLGGSVVKCQTAEGLGQVVSRVDNSTYWMNWWTLPYWIMMYPSDSVMHPFNDCTLMFKLPWKTWIFPLSCKYFETNDIFLNWKVSKRKLSCSVSLLTEKHCLVFLKGNDSQLELFKTLNDEEIQKHLQKKLKRQRSVKKMRLFCFPLLILTFI